MNKSLVIGSMAIALSASSSTPAWAQAETTSSATTVATAPAPRTAIGIDLGIASAVGLAGVTLTRTLYDHLRVELGAGFGVSGWQLSFMPKLVLGSSRDHFVSGVGVSLAFPTDHRSADGHPVWLNVDAAGYEHLFANGLAMSAAFGLTGGLGGGRLCVPSDGCEPQFLRDVTAYWGPQARVGLAYWF